MRGSMYVKVTLNVSNLLLKAADAERGARCSQLYPGVTTARTPINVGEFTPLRQVISKSSLCAWSQVGNSCQIRPRILVEAEIILQ